MLTEPGTAGNALGHWYANLIHLDRKPYVLALSERSLLSVVVPAAPYATLVDRFAPALQELLAALSVRTRDILREIEAMAGMSIAATANRRVLGVLNQFAFELEIDFSYNPERSLLEREIGLSQDMSSAIGYRHPRDVAIELLAGTGRQ